MHRKKKALLTAFLPPVTHRGKMVIFKGGFCDRGKTNCAAAAPDGRMVAMDFHTVSGMYSHVPFTFLQ